jgi:hypothetical protein
VKQREDVEAHLANYNIPFQILQMVAEQCECAIETRSTEKEVARKPKLSLLFARLNDRAIILLQQIFLDCHESLSTFRFTVFLSSRYSAMMHKFVIDEKISGKSNSEYTFDVCIYSRRTGDLIAVGMQNKNTKQQGSDSKSLLAVHIHSFRARTIRLHMGTNLCLFQEKRPLGERMQGKK